MSTIRYPHHGRHFYQALSRQVHDAIATQPHASQNLLFVKIALILLVYIASYAAMLSVDGAGNALSWVIHGVATALVGFNIMHDGAHESLSRSRRLNRLAALTFNLIGSHRRYWAEKHNRNHHGFTNVDGLDEDIDALGLLRMSPTQPHRAWHRYQHWYAWCLYPLTSLFWFFVLDYKAYFRQAIGDRAYSKPMGCAEHIEFWLSKALYLVLYLLLPSLVLGLSQTLVGFLLMHAVLGFLFAVVFQLAHVVSLAEFPQPNNTGELPDTWAIHQLRTTVDFAPQSRVLNALLGGLNMQVEHHLFPRISHIHYPQIHHLIRRECELQGHPIRTYQTLWQALTGHSAHLKALGHPLAKPIQAK